VAAVGLPAVAGAATSGSPSGVGRTPTPAGFVKYLVYLQNGVIDPSVPAPDTGEFFQTEVMARSPAEIAEDRARAVAYFGERFGLDFTEGDVDGAARFVPFMDARRNEYRAYTISGESVPAEG